MAFVTRGQGIGAIVLGILKVILGAILIIIGFVVKSKLDNALLACYWAGFIFLLPGILGIVAGATKNTCAMITYMILNIIFFILFGIGAILIFIIVAASASVLTDYETYCTYSAFSDICSCSFDGRSIEFNGSCSAITGLGPVLWGIAICCLFAGVLLFASSILGCVSSCCTNEPPTGFVYQEQPPAMHGGVVISSQQQMTSASFQPPPGYTPPAIPQKAGAI